MAKLPFGKDFMHIKNRTEGTSNEISFSVLDAKKNDAAESGSNSPRTMTELGKVSLFTMPGKQVGETASSASGFGMSRPGRKKSSKVVSGGATLVGSSEVIHRKQRRRLSKLLNVAAVLLVLGLLFFVGGNYLSNIMNRQNANETTLNSSIAFLEQTDEVFVALDEAVAQPAMASELNYEELLNNMSAAASLLDRSANSAEQVVNAHESDRTVEVASEVKNSALARKDLIEKGRTIIVQGAAAKSATNLIHESWDKMIEADAFARDAAKLMSEDPAKNIGASSELNTQAMNLFQESLALLRQAKAAFPRADLGSYEKYLELRAGAQQNALASNTAMQEADQSTVDSNNAAYNASEAEAAELAAHFAADPAQPVIDMYDEIGRASDEAYREAHARVARADAAIRSYKQMG